jgi:hypothetical protein
MMRRVSKGKNVRWFDLQASLSRMDKPRFEMKVQGHGGNSGDITPLKMVLAYGTPMFHVIADVEISYQDSHGDESSYA